MKHLLIVWLVTLSSYCVLLTIMTLRLQDRVKQHNTERSKDNAAINHNYDILLQQDSLIINTLIKLGK
jgi:hypothetical protein